MSGLETLAQFRERTSFVWQRPYGGLFVPADQRDKVDPDGRMKTYLGDTVIFDLDEDVKGEIARMQHALYEFCAPHGCLAEKLPPDSFHITLHDLISGPAEKQEAVLGGMEEREIAVNQILAEAEFETICMRATTLMSMMGKSVVLCFEPASEADCAALMALYERLQSVVHLGYRLTPHVTLAYYRPAQTLREEERGTIYGSGVTDALRAAFEQIGFRGGEVLLRKENLRYCCFADMSIYMDRQTMIRKLNVG